MKKVSFLTAFCAMCDAVRGKMRDGSSTDVACRVYAKYIRKLAAVCLAVMCFSGSVWANTAQQIAAQINALPPLQASANGDIVTVTGTLNALQSGENFLTLNISPGVTVIWQATLMNSHNVLININGGSGTFEMQSGSIENAGGINSIAIANN